MTSSSSPTPALTRVRVLRDSLLALRSGADTAGSVDERAGEAPPPTDALRALEQILAPLAGVELAGPVVNISQPTAEEQRTALAPPTPVPFLERLSAWLSYADPPKPPGLPQDLATLLLVFGATVPSSGGLPSPQPVGAVVLTARGDLRGVRPWALHLPTTQRATAIQGPHAPAALVEGLSTRVAAEWDLVQRGRSRPRPFVHVAQVVDADAAFLALYGATPDQVVDGACAVLERALLTQMLAVPVAERAALSPAVFKGLLLSADPRVRLEAMAHMGGRRSVGGAR